MKTQVGAGETGRCPHCKVSVRFELVNTLSPASGNFGQHHRIRFQTLTNHRLDIRGYGVSGMRSTDRGRGRGV
jgi:hypothetical protein